MADHGGAGTKYVNEGCRCDECREANARRIAKRRLSRDVADYTGPHGTPSAYVNWRCRCQPCTVASADSCRAYRERKKAEVGK